MKTINDEFSKMVSVVRFEPTSKISFIAEELRRYGIKTNKESKGKTIFYQSAHIISKVNPDVVDGELDFALVGFKDLFKIVGKNDDAIDDQDRMRIWIIAQKLEKRGMINILGTHDSLLDDNELPDDLPDCYANLCHIYRKSDEVKNYSYKSKFATNKKYPTVGTESLIGIADYFLMV